MTLFNSVHIRVGPFCHVSRIAKLCSCLLLLAAACAAKPREPTQQRGANPDKSAAQSGAGGPAPMQMGLNPSSASNPSSPVLVQPSKPVTPDQTAKRACKAETVDDKFELPVCKLKAPPGAFEPVLQWSVELGNGSGPPLVANLTDDNGDGQIDLCDTPDIVLVAGFEMSDLETGKFVPVGSKIYVLDGATGHEHFHTELSVNPTITPAIGDIDGDGLPDIVAASWVVDQFVNGEMLTGLVAFDHTGKVMWQVPLSFDNAMDQFGTGSVNLHDLDADGTVEVVVSTAAFNGRDGSERWNNTASTGALASVAVDLDMDGKLEVTTGLQTYDSQGNMVWDRSDLTQGNGFFADLINLIGVLPLVANLDDDPFPEILLAAGPGIYILEHDGQTKLGADGQPLTYKSTSEQGLALGDFKPPTAHDFDGDGKVDIAIGASSGFTVLTRELKEIYKYTDINQGLTATTGFDFLGDGRAEAIYGDAEELLFFDVAAQKVVMRWPHSGQLDYPIVVDVDNDDSAEVIIVSAATVKIPMPGELMLPEWTPKKAPTLQVLTDKMDRWIPTRRVWNMQGYHVTHVREDSTIPQVEQPHYLKPNTFRTNVQYEAGGICMPEVPNPD